MKFPAPATPPSVPALLVAVAALGGTLALGGLRPAEAALVVALAAIGVLRAGDTMGARVGGAIAAAPPAPEPTAPPWVDHLVVTALTLAFFVSAVGLANPHQPIGTDWMAYLGNAVAAGTGEWAQYHDWRGPLHAWACLALVPVSGGLIAASQHLSLICATLLVPLTWWIGRMLLGRWPALLAAGLLAGWADLRLFAAYSTPYALLAATGTLGIALTVASRRRPLLAAPAGVALGLAVATDLRGGLFAGAVVLAAALDAGGARRLIVVSVLALATIATGAGALSALPVPLVPLSAQVAFQRDLNAREGAGTCAPQGTALPTLAEAFGECGRTTLAGNLALGAAALPIELPALALLVGMGLLVARGGRGFLLLPVLPTLPSLLFIGGQHRYFVPLAPLFALLGAATLAWLTRAAGRRRALGGGVVVVMVLVLAAAWNLWPGTLWVRAHTGRSVDPGSLLEGPSTFGHLRAALVPRLGEDDTVVDCARAGLRMRLYPHPVDTMRTTPASLGKACTGLLHNGSRARGVKWLVVAVGPGEPIAASWEVVWRAPESPGREALLLRSAGTQVGDGGQP
ncbi:MAG: hypothetical protein Q8P18_09585 [Pseudomonadota bacterium]|nr:hypothetical protein [Pseudomonadota bacterium]